MIVSVIFGLNFSYIFLFHSGFSRSILMKYLAIFSVIIILGTFSYYFFYLDLNFLSQKNILLTSDLGNLYQGVGRSISFCSIILAFSTIFFPLKLASLFIGFLLVANYKSIGAILGMFLAFIITLTRFSRKNISQFFLIVFLFSIPLFIINYLEINLLGNLIESFDLANERIGKKVGGHEIRLQVFEKALQLWTENSYNFLFGVGPVNFGCGMRDCDEGFFFYTHNIFLTFVVYFGLFGFLFCFIVLKGLFLSIKEFLFSRNYQLKLFGVLMIFFFILANIGGDFSGNRNFWAFLTIIFCLSPYITNIEAKNHNFIQYSNVAFLKNEIHFN
ncbi:MAG: O-antigen ligase family protein [Flavobacteriales bacterium]|nr:O-antigen ligase family protein [Flavobacteriales bacterium]